MLVGGASGWGQWVELVSGVSEWGSEPVTALGG